MARAKGEELATPFAAWVEQAQRDLEAAIHMRAGGFHEWSHYCALQAAEKIEKAFYVALGIQFPKEHNLIELSKAWADTAPRLRGAMLYLNNDLNSSTRYPDAEGPPSRRFTAEKSDRAIRAAKEVVDFCTPRVERAAEFRRTLGGSGQGSGPGDE